MATLCHCEECPFFLSLRGRTESFRSNLLLSTSGNAIRLYPRNRRLPRALRALAMTNLGTQREKDTQRFLGTPNHHTVLPDDDTHPRHCEECRKARRSNLIAWIPRASLVPYVRHCEEGRSPSEAISFFQYFWNSHPIVTQLPEIATGPEGPSQ